MGSIMEGRTKTCVLCGHKNKDGIFIYTGYICEDCEYEIVHTDVSDEKYPFIIERMKDLWLKNA